MQTFWEDVLNQYIFTNLQYEIDVGVENYIRGGLRLLMQFFSNLIHFLMDFLYKQQFYYQRDGRVVWCLLNSPLFR